MLTALLIFWPFVAALIALALNHGQAKIWALFAALIEVVISFVVVFYFEPTATPQFALNSPWIASLGINFNVAIDGNSITFEGA